MASITHETVAAYGHNALVSQQYFVGNPLDRSCLTGNRKDPDLLTAVLCDETSKCLVCSQQLGRGNSKLILCEKSDCSSPLLQLSFLTMSETLRVTGCMSTSDLILFSEVVLLGQDKSGCWVISIDVSSNTTNNEDILSTVAAFPDRSQTALFFNDARTLLHKASQHCFSQSEVALAGQVFAISGWHATNRFMGSTGQPTIPVECGMKRSIGPTSREKVYPRIDPVAICLVISPDGESVLLGRMKRGRPGFFSCLSGFVEQCESVQEAVCREVREESGVQVQLNDVRLVDSQPWPLGRGGGCELMLGCIAQASSTKITIHDHDVEEVRWFSRQELRSLIAKQQQLSNVEEIAKNKAQDLSGTTTGVVESIPGEYAIAYHLIRAFVNDGEKDERENDISDTTVPSCRLSLFLVPVLMFLINAKLYYR